jgi:hypothetical protein
MNDTELSQEATKQPNASQISQMETFTKVTLFSKALAIALFIILPFLGFYLGYQYQRYSNVQPNQPQSLNTNPSTNPGVGDISTASPNVGATPPSIDDVVTPNNPPSGGGGTVNPSSPTYPPTPTGATDECAMSNCHGLDITCAYLSEPLMCTELYMLGDGCRQYASCKVIGGTCQPILSQQFKDCKSCAESCQTKNQNDSIAALECEYECTQ